MPLSTRVNRSVTAAVFFGLAALATRSLCNFSSLDGPVHLENVWLFISALSLGLRGALITAAFGFVPEAVINGHHVETLRTITLCVALGLSSERFPRLPGFVITFGLWLVVYGPAIIVFGRSQPLATEQVLFSGLGDIFLTLISGTVLLNRTAWSFITERPRHLTISMLLLHLIPLVSTAVMFLSLIVIEKAGTSYAGSSISHHFAGIVALIVLAITLPSVLAWRLADIIATQGQDLFAGKILGKAQKQGFSGLSTEYWRRKSSTQLLRPGADLTESMTVLRRKNASSTERTSFAAPDAGICALNRNGTISFTNRKFLNLLDIKNNEVVGKKIDSIDLPTQLSDPILALVEQTFTIGAKVIEVKLHNPGQPLRYFEISSQRSDAFERSSITNGPDSIIISLRDITDRRTIESHLLEAQKLRALGGMVGGLAHSFNNTLTSIVGQVDLAKRAQEPKARELALDAILTSTSNASSVVNQLIDFSEQRPYSYSMNKVNLGAMLNERLTLLRQTLGDQIEIVFDAQSSSIGASCDSILIMQALHNLIQNARESYNDDCSKVWLSLETEEMAPEVCNMVVGASPGNYARLRVKDEGSGMTQDVLAKAFEPLFTTKAAKGHSGLGLSVVYAVVRAHDGFMTVESQAGKGTTISIYLPLVTVPAESAQDETRRSNEESQPLSEAAQAVPSSARDLKGVMGNHEGLMVVEDDDNVRELVAKMLGVLGYEVTSCRNGSEALQCFENGKYALVLVDMLMPGMNAPELLKKIRQASPNTPCMVMTGYGTSVKIPNNNTKVLPKPFDLETLAKAVKEALIANTQVH